MKVNIDGIETLFRLSVPKQTFSIQFRRALREYLEKHSRRFRFLHSCGGGSLDVVVLLFEYIEGGENLINVIKRDLRIEFDAFLSTQTDEEGAQPAD